VGVEVGAGVSVGSGVSVGTGVSVGSGVLLGSGVGGAGVAVGSVPAPPHPASQTRSMLKMIHRFIIRLLFSNCNHIGGIFNIKTRSCYELHSPQRMKIEFDFQSSTPRGTQNTRVY